MKQIAFSGIQPSGNLHIGNYFGSIFNWKKIQDNYDCIFSIVDLHSITVEQSPVDLKNKILEIAAIYIASGIDPKKNIIFVQSEVKEHLELFWILNCMSYFGELSRMTQFKDKSKRLGKDQSSAGLFNYPVLMASDILLYDTNFVPVGYDQKQHIELARDLAERFNKKFGETFTIPEPLIQKDAKIMGLDNPENKMSKSAKSKYNRIDLMDSNDEIVSKIKKAVTDNTSEIKFDKKRKGIYNLLNIYRLLSDMTENEIESNFVGKNYGYFKKELIDLLISEISPIRENVYSILKDKSNLEKILEDGSIRARNIANKKIITIKNKLGLGIN
ncbi:tryptophan--tRNA ligase [Patescibacteria group bacterium]|nr:tryptophan--tRNA ligase [Patescibacteria group bacterium]